MAVYDIWHKQPKPGAEPCKCGSAKHPLYPSAKHKQGDRWEVRWRDDMKEQKYKRFVKKEGTNPELHADAFDKTISADLLTDNYNDPRSGETLFEEYAEEWRTARTHGESTGIGVEYRLRLHVYSDPDNPKRTRRGGPALGHLQLKELAKRPSLVQQWISGMKLSDSSKVLAIGDVYQVLSAAIDDGLISRNPLNAKSVSRPHPQKREVVPLTADEVEALSRELRHRPCCKAGCDKCGPTRFQFLPKLGAATGMRQGEMLAVDVDKDLDFLRRVVHVRRQMKRIHGALVFAPLKNGKIHDVPMTDTTAIMLSEYMKAYPPAKVTLPWAARDGEDITFNLLLTDGQGGAMSRNMANNRWRGALTRAGIPADQYHMMHVTRHTFASFCLSAGISIRAVAECLGDTEAVVQATYSHLMPDDTDRLRKAIDGFFGRRPDESPSEARAS